MNTKKILYNKDKKTFVITKDTLEAYRAIQEDLGRRDLLNHSLYSNSFLLQSIEQNSMEVLDKYLSVAHKMLLITFYMKQGANMSLLQAVALSFDTHIQALTKGLSVYDSLLVNERGGYQPFSLDERNFSEYVLYNWEDSNIIDKGTAHLVLENSHKVEEHLLEKMNENLTFSIITNFKYIIKSEKVDSFLRERDDWNLWVYTQGADIELYKKFLSEYSPYIKKINVYFSDIAIVQPLIEEYPSIEFIEL